MKNLKILMAIVLASFFMQTNTATNTQTNQCNIAQVLNIDDLKKLSKMPPEKQKEHLNSLLQQFLVEKSTSGCTFSQLHEVTKQLHAARKEFSGFFEILDKARDSITDKPDQNNITIAKALGDLHKCPHVPDAVEDFKNHVKSSTWPWEKAKMFKVLWRLDLLKNKFKHILERFQ